MAEKAKILLVEDDDNLGFVIKDSLSSANFRVELATNGQAGLEEFNKKNFDICILDVMLPKKDGFTLAEEIRAKNQEIPIIFLTAKSLPEDKIKGLRIGADDYITKPFNSEELILRVEAILKRSKQTDTPKRNDFKLGYYSFDHANQALKRGEDSSTLTKKEADLLHMLCVNQNNIVERETALKSIWGEDDYFLGRSMDVFITKLRKHLKDDPRIKIVNVHGVGFRLEIEDELNKEKI